MDIENYIESWNVMADDLDISVGNNGNRFQRELLFPATLHLLNPKSEERILEIACGNGVFARHLAMLGAKVVAFDYSPKMISYAQKNCALYNDNISLFEIDATQYNQVIALGKDIPFDKAVANMMVMNIPDIAPLFHAVYNILVPNGLFVFSVVHPCFQTPSKEYISDGLGLGIYHYIETQYCIEPVYKKPVWHWHRPLQDLLQNCFKAGFVLDGIEEPVCKLDTGVYSHPIWEQLPLIIVFRLRK